MISDWPIRARSQSYGNSRFAKLCLRNYKDEELNKRRVSPHFAKRPQLMKSKLNFQNTGSWSIRRPLEIASSDTLWQMMLWTYCWVFIERPNHCKPPLETLCLSRHLIRLDTFLCRSRYCSKTNITFSANLFHMVLHLQPITQENRNEVPSSNNIHRHKSHSSGELSVAGIHIGKTHRSHGSRLSSLSDRGDMCLYSNL